jgi:inner membrane protein
MDLLTQGLLGSALSISIAQERHIRLACGVGMVAGLLADADVLIASGSDPLLAVEFHRHFTHSVFFIPFGALIAAGLLWPLLRKRLAFGRLYLYCLAGFSLSGLLDACTSYGTHLFWPLSDARISFHLISIVDPVFTAILLLAVLLAWRYRKVWVVYIGLALCSAYLVLGYVQLQRATGMARDLALAREHRIERLVVKPTLGNLLLWRSTYISGNTIYVDALRAGVSSRKVYTGDSVALFVPERDAKEIPTDSVLYKDILRFRRFADGYIAMDPEIPHLLGDMRYSILPTALNSLWGITLDFEHPGRHAHYGFYRVNTREVRARFWSMLKGAPVL